MRLLYLRIQRISTLPMLISLLRTLVLEPVCFALGAGLVGSAAPVQVQGRGESGVYGNRWRVARADRVSLLFHQLASRMPDSRHVYMLNGTKNGVKCGRLRRHQNW